MRTLIQKLNQGVQNQEHQFSSDVQPFNNVNDNSGTGWCSG